MIEDYVSNLIENNLDKFENTFGIYFTEEYYSYIYSSIANSEFIVSRTKGLCEVLGEKVYLMDEPMCVKKDDKSVILMPLSFFKNPSCNISLAHLLLHALFSEYEDIEYNVFNEVIIDYIANDMGNLLKNNEANVCVNDEVNYKSNSLYKHFYPLIEDYYLKNREKINHDLIVNNHNYMDEETKEVARKLQNAFDDYCLKFFEKKENKIIKK